MMEKAARILIVEDERIVAMNLKGKLEGMGYSVPSLAASGEDATALADRLRPDLVLMDIRLDGAMDGVEAAGIIRDRLRIPVVYLTAYSNRDIVERAKVTEPFGYILKPFVDRELQVVIEMALYRHQKERQLLEQQRLLAATLRSIGDGVIATDSHSRVTFLNPVAEHLTGWTQAEALGRPVHEVFPLESEKSKRPVDSPLVKAMREKVTVPLENHTALIARDQTRVPIYDSAAPILDDTNTVLGGVIVFRDMSPQRVASQNALQLAAIVASSEDAIISMTAAGVITSWNAAAVRLYGYTAAEAVGQNIILLAPPESVPEVLDALARIQNGERVAPDQALRMDRNGRMLEVIVTVSPLKNEEGEIIGATAIVRDVQPLRQLEAQFRQAQKMEAIGRLAGGIAHDFNNLMTIINGYSNFVLEELDPHDPHREMLEQVVRAGERAASLTSQLLAYSRRSMLQPRVVDLNGLVRSTEKMLRPIIGEDIELRIVTDDRLLRVRVDPAQMEQAIVNLAVNARDAMPQGGALTLETVSRHLKEADIGVRMELTPGPYTLLTVSDTGCGMDEDTLARLFEPFFTTKEVGKGTGLGLAMVYGTIKQSGGHVEVTSTPGEGSTFRIYLPGIDVMEHEEPKTAQIDRPGGAETILLVEDEEGVRKLVALQLEHCGYTVKEAANGAEALEIIARHRGRIDLMLSDVVMPGMNGPQLAAAVEVAHPGVKVLFQSGHPGETLLFHGFEATHHDLIQKPFSSEELARRVRDVLRK